MKRPSGLWILLSAGVLWLSLQDVYGIRATALIFGKYKTSGSTEATTTVTAEERIDVGEAATNTENPEVTADSNSTANGNSTGPKLTGNPQIDYIYDPNLPQELNGYNLSEYPFYERVPENINKEIVFKCDGLHDGFYASIPHKCQVYHHCLFGMRYDFLCGNYTAFDQKSFICQYVSQVDCVNSKNFWHRNDALYQAASTTTVAPIRSIYTTAPPDVGEPITPRRPAGGGQRRPYRPRYRRPQVEYYDDEYYDDEYYEDRPRARGRKRPATRPRPRPVYDDEDVEYEDERYESRRTGGRKRPYRKRNRDRKKPEYDDEEEVEDKFEDDDFIAANKRKKNEDKRNPPVEEEVEERDQRRPNGKRRFPNENKREQDEIYDRQPPRKTSGNKRPINDDSDKESPQPSRKTLGNKRPTNDDYDEELPQPSRKTSANKRPKNDDYDEELPQPSRKTSANKRPKNDDYDEELTQSDDSRNYEQRPRKKLKEIPEDNPDERPIIKPATGTIYDRPRLAPRINLPVPKNAAEKFAFKPAGGARASGTTKAPPSPEEEEEYLDEEYEERPPRRQKNRNRRPSTENKREISQSAKNQDSRDQPSESRQRIRKPEVEEIVEKTTTVRPKFNIGRNRYTRPTVPSKKRPVSVEYYDDEEYVDEEKDVQDRRPALKRTTSTSTTTSTTTTTTTTTPAPKKQEPAMRIIKRPFLPSRGGSPYNSRGLQPVGLKAVDKINEEKDSNKEVREEDKNISNQKDEPDYYEDSSGSGNEKVERNPSPPQEDVQSVRKPYFKPSPVLMKVPIRTKYNKPSADVQEIIDSEPSYQQTYKTRDYPNSRTTPRPIKVVENNPLDLNEYDVTLNDALNPTLPNLPVRSFPTGFSSGGDYKYNTFTRPRYVLEPIISPSNQDFTRSNKVVRSQQRYETVPQNQYSTINGGYNRQQGQTQALYSGY